MWLVITIANILAVSGHIIELKDHVMYMQYTFPKIRQPFLSHLTDIPYLIFLYTVKHSLSLL